MYEMKYGASLHCSVNRELEIPLAVGWSFDADPLIHFLGVSLCWFEDMLAGVRPFWSALVEESR